MILNAYQTEILRKASRRELPDQLAEDYTLDQLALCAELVEAGYLSGRPILNNERVCSIVHPAITLPGREYLEALHQRGRVVRKTKAPKRSLPRPSRSVRRKPRHRSGSPTTPTCFISYSWDSASHKKWVRRLGTDLRSNGVDARLDQWDVRLGTDLPRYMETSIRESDFVLLICTPVFARKADEGSGGVGYEKTIVTGEIYQGAEPTKFVPILKKGKPSRSLPSYLKNKAYSDFRSQHAYDTGLKELVSHLLDQPQFPLPPIGKKPGLERSSPEVATKRPRDSKTPSALGQTITQDEVLDALKGVGQLDQGTVERDYKRAHTHFLKGGIMTSDQLWDLVASTGIIGTLSSVYVELLGRPKGHPLDAVGLAIFGSFLYANGCDPYVVSRIKQMLRNSEEYKSRHAKTIRASPVSDLFPKSPVWASTPTLSLMEKEKPLFRALYDFAYQTSGLNLPASQSADWASEHMAFFKRHDFDKFRNLYASAYQDPKMNLSPSKAIEWAMQEIQKA